MTETYKKYMFSPNNPSYNCSGLLLQPDGSSLGWIRIPCTERFNASFACAKARNTSLGKPSHQQLSKIKKCKTGWILIKDNCYYIKIPSVKIITAFDVMQTCASLNASLPVIYYFYDTMGMSKRQKHIRDSLAIKLRRGRTLELIHTFTDRSQQDFPSVDIFSESTEEFGSRYKPYGKYPIRRALESTILELLDILFYLQPMRDQRSLAVWTSSSTSPCLYVDVSQDLLKTTDMMNDVLKPITYPWLGENLACSKQISVNYLVCTAVAEQVENTCPSGYYVCEDGSCIMREYVQDGHRDCNNGDDETVRHPFDITAVSTEYYTCISFVKDDTLLSIPFHAVCDGISQCPNNDDEEVCSIKEEYKYNMPDLVRMTASSCAINKQFISFCYFDRHIRQGSDSCYSNDYLSHCEIIECSSMFKCDKSYCISVDKVCDGIVDCLGGGDEEGCTDHVCTGMLKCRGEVHCVGSWQLCDGIPHCKTFDDEVNCQACPDNCNCSGHVIVCHAYTDKWFLNVTDIFKVIKLRGHINDLSFLGNFQIIKILDVSHSNITTLYYNYSDSYAAIPYVYLNNNNLKSMSDIHIDILTNVFYLNISYNRIIMIDNIYFARASFLDISYNKLTHIYKLNGLPMVRYINLEGNKIIHIENRFLEGLSSLIMLNVNENLVCCVIKMTKGCHSSNNINTCPRLLPIIKKCTFISLALINMLVVFISLIRKVINKKQTKSRSDRGILTIKVNMAISCLIINIYICAIVAGDIYYSRSYAQQYNSWISSSTCKLAGAICLLSNGACILFSCTKSAYILLKTVFPFKQIFNKLRLTCLIVWCVKISISVPSIFVISNESEHYDNLNHVGFELCILTYKHGEQMNLIIVFGAAIGYISQISCYYIVYKLSCKSAMTSGYSISNSRTLKFVTVVLLSTLPDLCFILTYTVNAVLCVDGVCSLVYILISFPLIKLASIECS